MGESFLDKNGGGFDVNGLIEDYYAYAGENINAGSFVEFVNGIANSTTETSVDTKLSPESLSGYTISAVELPNGNVFVAHSYGSNYYLYGMIVIINKTDITYGTDTLLVNYSNSGAAISTVVLSNGNVFIAHSYGTNYILNGIVCTVAGTTIGIGTDKQLSTTSYSGRSISASILSNGYVFIAHSYNTGLYLRGMVCLIIGTTIDRGSDYLLNGSVGYTGTTISVSTLSNGNVFVAHSYGSNYYLYGMICTIPSGTEVSYGSDIRLSTKEKLYRSIKSLTLKNDNVFITHCDDNDNFSLYGMVCTISDTNITAGVDTQLSNLYKSGIIFDANIMKDGNIFIAHIVDSNPVHSLICSISGKTITYGNQYILDNNLVDVQNKIKSLLLSNGTICLFHDIHNDSNDNTLNAQVFGITDNVPSNNIIITEYEPQVRKSTSFNSNGIAKTSGVGGDDTVHNDMISMYVSKLIENLVVNGDFSDGTNGWSIASENVAITTIVDGKLKLTINTTSNSGYTLISSLLQITIPKGHNVYIKGKYSATLSNSTNYIKFRVSNSGGTGILIELPSTSQEENFSIVSSNDKTDISRIMVSMSQYTTGDIVIFDDIKVYDLTAYYGAGNEPTKEWCDKNL